MSDRKCSYIRVKFSDSSPFVRFVVRFQPAPLKQIVLCSHPRYLHFSPVFRCLTSTAFVKLYFTDMKQIARTMHDYSIRNALIISAGICALLAPNLAFSAMEGVRLVGLAMHQDTGRNIYIGALHYDELMPMPEDIVAADGPMTMEYRVVARRTSIRSVMGGVLLQSELATGDAPSKTASEFVENIMAAVKGSLYAGDSLEIRLNKDSSVVAILDGQQLASTADRQVSNYFLMGWVGERGPSTVFRSSILATEVDSALLPIYEARTASSQRIAAIEAWPEKENTSPVPTNSSTPIAVTITTPAAGNTVPTIASATAPSRAHTAVSTDLTSLSTELKQAVEDAAKAAPQEAAAEQTSTSEPVLLASAAPTREMIQPAMEDAMAGDVISAMEYSRRLAVFNTNVLRSVYTEIRYPRAAVRRNIQGTLELDLKVDKNGQLLNVSIAVSSGHKMLDNSALKAANKAFSDKPLQEIDQVARSEYSEEDGEKLIIPIPVSFILTE
jgi:TonB family protein